jgi:predicted transcriptional regulator
MFESFHEVFLGFLTDEESERMIHEIGAWRNIKWEAEAAQEVFYYCGGHPLITRYFASYACEAGTRKSIDLARVEESAKEIRAALRRNEIGNYYKESVWMVLREDERELLATLSREGRQSLPESDVPGKLQDALTHLEQFGLVKLASGRVAVTSQILYEWLRRMPP